jgi:hypothetical protein
MSVYTRLWVTVRTYNALHLHSDNRDRYGIKVTEGYAIVPGTHAGIHMRAAVARVHVCHVYTCVTGCSAGGIPRTTTTCT